MNRNKMKKFLISFITLVFVCIGVSAQQEELRKVAERYKTVNTLITDVTQTRHNVALTKDIVTKGHFYYKGPNCQSMVFKSSREMLLAKDNTFVMVKDGKQHTTKAKGLGNNPFETLRDVFRNLLSTNDNAALTDAADVKFTKQGNTCTITITPIVTTSKAKRRMMFTSCVATIDLTAGELRSLRINEPSGNYTQYDLSNYVFNSEVSNSVFDTQMVM